KPTLLSNLRAANSAVSLPATAHPSLCAATSVRPPTSTCRLFLKSWKAKSSRTWSLASAQLISFLARWTAKRHATVSATYGEVRQASKRLSRQAQRSYSHDDVRSGRTRLRQRRNECGNRRASRFAHGSNRRDTRLLLDAPPQADGQASRAGLHERRLHAARRLRNSGPGQEAA